MVARFYRFGFLLSVLSLTLAPSPALNAASASPQTQIPVTQMSPEELVYYKQTQLAKIASHLLPPVFHPDAATRSALASTSNNYLNIQLLQNPTGSGGFDSATGAFGTGTTNAYANTNPQYDNQKLLYGWPNSLWSSYSTLRLDSTTVKYGDSTGVTTQQPTVTQANIQIQMQWEYSGMAILNTFTLVDSLDGYPDTVEITYQITNTTQATHQVGFRIMLDTDVANNDGAPINVVGQPYSANERSFTAPNVPQYWQAYAGTPGNPGLTAQGTLSGANATTPDRFVVAHWPLIYDGYPTSGDFWNFTVAPGTAYTSDSAVGMWWNQKPLLPGASIRYTTYYGLGRSATCQQTLGVNFSAPDQLAVVNCGYNPNPFQAQVVVQNPQSITANGVSASLTLPAGLTFTNGSSTTVNLNNIPANGQANGSWWIFADGSQTGTLTMAMTVSTQNSGQCNLTKTIIIPPIVCTPSPTGNPSETPTPTETPATATPQPTETPTGTIPTFTPFPKESATPEEPTMTPTPTWTFPPTPTPVPIPPVILAAGWGNTYVTTEEGGDATLTAYISTPGGVPINHVEILSSNVSTGLFLAPQAGSYSFSTHLDAGIPPGLYLLELSAVDDNHQRSATWPYFSIVPSYAQPPQIPDYAELMRKAIEADDSRGPRAGESQDAGQSSTGPNPSIVVAGYMGSRVTTNGGGEFELLSYVEPVAEVVTVNLLLGQQPTNISLTENGNNGASAGSGVYGYETNIGSGNSLGATVLELQATDPQGNKSFIWPYLNVISVTTPTPTLTPTATNTPTPIYSYTPTSTATLTPTLTPTVTPTPLPNCCFTISPPVQTSGSWVNVDASCTTFIGQGPLTYAWNWGDGTSTTNYSQTTQAQHVYTTPNNSGYTITLYVKTPGGTVVTCTQTVKIIP